MSNKRKALAVPTRGQENKQDEISNENRSTSERSNSYREKESRQSESRVDDSSSESKREHGNRRKNRNDESLDLYSPPSFMTVNSNSERQRELGRRKEMRNKKLPTVSPPPGELNDEDSSTTISPPSYSVVETETGKLVNRTLNVVWPERPTTGRHSVGEYLKRKNQRPMGIEAENDYDEACPIPCRAEYFEVSDVEKNRTPQTKRHTDRLSLTEAYSELSTDVNSNIDNDNSAEFIPESELSGNGASKVTHGVPQNLIQYFAGVQTVRRVEKMLCPTQFLLYYRRGDETGKHPDTLDKLPLTLPLMLAYMTNSGKVQHYQFAIDRLTDGRTMWRVLTEYSGMETHLRRNEQPAFHTMTGLLSFYQAFGNMNAKGEIEIFPESN